MRRNDLKQAAIRVFAAKGYHTAKVSDIVAEAGVAQGTFYLYYSSKQSLFGELLGDYLTLITNAVSGWDITGVDDLSQLRRDLKKVGLQLTQEMLNNRELTRIFFNEALAVDPEFNRMIGRFYDQVASLIGSVNRYCFEKGLYRRMDSEVISQCVVGLIERVVIRYVVNNCIDEQDTEQIIEQVIDLVLFGVSKSDY